MTHEIQHELKSTRVLEESDSGKTGSVLSARKYVPATDAIAAQERLKNSDWDFVWYPNPKPSIAQAATLFHVQVFWTIDRATHGNDVTLSATERGSTK